MVNNSRGFIRDRFFWFFLLVPVPFWLGLYFYFDYRHAPGHEILNLKYLALVLIYPVLEEIVFRGLIQENLQKRFAQALGPITLANVLTSIAFTALHFFYHAPLWAMLVFIPSLIFGFFKDRHQSLLPPIILHIFYNAGYYTLFA